MRADSGREWSVRKKKPKQFKLKEKKLIPKCLGRTQAGKSI